MYRKTVLMALGMTAIAAAGCGKNPSEPTQNTPAAAQPAGEATNGFDGMPPAGTKAFCPVMKKEFTVSSASPHSEYQGKTYVFCCPSCKTKFDANPQQFVAADAPESAEKEAPAAPQKAQVAFDAKPAPGTKAICPVMRKEFTVDENTPISEYQGKFYAFCCPGCKPKFDANPQTFLAGGDPGDNTQETAAASQEAPIAFDAKPAPGTKAICPVSKETFTVDENTPVSEYQGKFYAFCCPGCKPKFDANPQQFL